MGYVDLRGWIQRVDELGELRRVEGADWDLEIGGITDLVSHRPNAPALLFDKIKGYPAGYRVIANMLGTNARLGLTLGLPAEKDKMAFLRSWREKFKTLKLTSPKEVDRGPVTENMHEGQEIDLLEFPAPKWHELDGGRFLGTADVVITRDPETGWVNLGIWRGQVHSKAAIGITAVPDRHATIHMRKHFALGKPFPAAVAYGCDPLLFLVATMNFPYGTSEYDIAGGLRGEPVKVLKGELTGLPIPASAEIVVEGEVVEGDMMPEGPFGEWPGYYAGETRERPVLRIKRVMHRNDPIVTGAPPLKPPSANAYLGAMRRSAVVWDQIEAAGIPEVRGVWSHEASGGPLFTVVSIKQRYPGHAKQTGLVVSQCGEGLRNGKYIVVVDEDIDPANLEEVLWAICTRSDPRRSIDIIDRCYGSQADPAIPRAQRDIILNSRAIIDACRPFEWMKDFPPVVEVSPERKKILERKWKELLG